MLVEHLVNFCDEKYRAAEASQDICKNCNHPNECPKDCKECLDQVHWLKDSGRRDYDCGNLLNYYTCRYSHKYTSEIIHALNTVDLSRYPKYNVLSLGCGAAPDLMALEYINKGENKPIDYLGCDKNSLWKKIHCEINNYAQMPPSAAIKCDFFYEDVFQCLQSDNSLSDCNALFMQYFLSHLYNTNQTQYIQALFEFIIRNILTHKLQNSPFLIIINDIASSEKGAEYFWIFADMIKKARYEIKKVSAWHFEDKNQFGKSKKHPDRSNRFDISQHIKDQYCCAIKCTSAQLIIEIQ